MEETISFQDDAYADKEANDLATNLSAKTLTPGQISLLSRGNKFIPNNRKTDLTKVLSDIKEWERRMRLREYFFQEDPIAEEEGKEGEKWDKKKKSSNFTPGSGRDRCLDTYIDCVRGDISSGLKANVKWNITKEEEIAMKELLSDDTIVIRQADKGSGVVVLDSEDYIEKRNAELKDSKTYKQTDEDNKRDKLKDS